MKTSGIVLISNLCQLLSLGQAQAQESKKETADVLNSLYGNFAPADLTAPSLLDVKADEVSKPSSVKNVTGNLIQSFAGFEGVGLEVAPFMFLRTSVDSTAPKLLANSIEAYRKKAWLRGITLSGASVSNDTSSQLAAGVGWVVYDGTDPLIPKGYAETLARGLINMQRTNSANDVLTGFAAEQNPVIDNIVWGAVGRGNTVKHDMVYNLLTDVIFKFPRLTGITTPKLDEKAKRKQEDDELAKMVRDGTLTASEVKTIQKELGPVREVFATLYDLYVIEADKLVDAIASDVKGAQEAFEKRKWNATVVQLGAAQVWQSPDKKWGTLHKQSFGVFARAAIRPSGLGTHFSKHGLVILNAQYKWANNDSLKTQLNLGARFSYGNYKFRVAVQSSWQNRQYQESEKTRLTSPNQWLWSLSAGPEFRISENLWVQIAFGSSSLNQSASLFTLANVKYSFRKTDAFTPSK